MKLRRLHLVLGVVTVVVFLLTGQYLRIAQPGGTAPDSTVRYLFRANHVYILLAGLPHLVLGRYLVLATARWRRVVQRASSVLLCLSPAVLLAAFALEPPHPDPERPLTGLGVQLLFAGTLGHLVAAGRAPE